MKLEDIKHIINKYFYFSFQGFIIINLFLLAFGIFQILPLLDFTDDLVKSIIWLITVSIAVIFHNSYWILSYYKIPKVNKSTKGIVIAIISNDFKYYKDIDWNYIRNVNELLREYGGISAKIQLVWYHQALRLKKTFDAENFVFLDKLLRTSGNTCIIFMDMTCDGEASNKKFLQLESKHGFVVHNPIPKEISNRFASELYKVIRQDIFGNEELSIVEYKAKAGEMAVISKYILGVTSFLCYELYEADKILNTVKSDLQGIHRNTKALNYIKSAIRQKIYEVNREILGCLYLKFQRSYDDFDALNELYERLILINTIMPNCKEYFVGMAYYTFWKERDIGKCQYFNDLLKFYFPGSPEALLNEAFFDSYKGKLSSAYKKYKKLFKNSLNCNILLIEEFINKVLEQENRPCLLFALAIINYFYKNDKVLGLQYLNSFKESDVTVNDKDRELFSVIEKDIVA